MSCRIVWSCSCFVLRNCPGRGAGLCSRIGRTAGLCSRIVWSCIQRHWVQDCVRGLSGRAGAGLSHRIILPLTASSAGLCSGLSAKLSGSCSRIVLQDCLVWQYCLAGLFPYQIGSLILTNITPVQLFIDNPILSHSKPLQ